MDFSYPPFCPCKAGIVSILQKRGSSSSHKHFLAIVKKTKDCPSGAVRSITKGFFYSKIINIFSCEDAALQVLMSVCVCVCGQFTFGPFQNIPFWTVPEFLECSRMCQNVPECVRQFQNVLDHSRVFQNVSDNSRMFWTIQECSGPFQNVPECIQNVPKCIQNDPEYMQNVPEFMHNVPKIIHNVP